MANKKNADNQSGSSSAKGSHINNVKTTLNLNAANFVSRKYLKSYINKNCILRQEAVFIDKFRKTSLPAYSYMIDTDSGLFVEEVTQYLSGKLSLKNLALANEDYIIISLRDLKTKVNRYTEQEYDFDNLCQLIAKMTIAIENMDLLASMTVKEFDRFLSFIKAHSTEKLIFFGDFSITGGCFAARLDAIKASGNTRSFSIRDIKIAETGVLIAAFEAAGFHKPHSEPLNSMWLYYRKSRLTERISTGIKEFISKTIFHHMSYLSGELHLTAASFGWLGINGSPECTAARPSALEKLDRMIGLGEVKTEIEKVVAHALIVKLKREAGLLVAPPNLNCLFLGNPGTGKTSVAYIYAQALSELGILKSGHLITASRGTLIAQYIGQTSPLTTEIFLSALDGVLLIDEAYGLYTADLSLDSYGKECINTLTGLMTEYQGRIAVIAAGYEEQMMYMLKSVNPGFADRFPNKWYFNDYNSLDLIDIFKLKVKDASLIIEDEGVNLIRKTLMTIYKQRDETFSNGRTVENVLQKLIAQQEMRLASMQYQGTKPSAESLKTISFADCNTVCGMHFVRSQTSAKRAIGFSCSME